MTSKKKHILTASQLDNAEKEIVERSRRIDFYMTEYSVEMLATKMENGDFVIPNYQRDFTWEPKRRSRFIESLIMGLPIPFLFFWEMENGKLEIVDGSQRLRTLQAYILGGMSLSDLQELPALNNTKFENLLLSRQRKIKNRSIRGIILNEHADAQARFDMFERINTGSKQANTAEVRRGALGGPFLDLVLELSKLPLFAKLAPISNKSRQLQIPEELVTRFFAYGDGLSDYKDSPMQFTFNYTQKMNELFQKNKRLRGEYKKNFIKMLQFVEKTFPTGFCKSTHLNSTPRARFEAIAIGSFNALKEDISISENIPDVSSWIESKEFKDITTADGANSKSKLANRIDFVKTHLLD